MDCGLTTVRLACILQVMAPKYNRENLTQIEAATDNQGDAMYFVTLLDGGSAIYLEACRNFKQKPRTDDLEIMTTAASIQQKAFKGLVDIFYNDSDDTDYATAITSLLNEHSNKRVAYLNQLVGENIFSELTLTQIYNADVDAITQKNTITDIVTALFESKLTSDQQTFVAIASSSKNPNVLQNKLAIPSVGLAIGGLALGAWMLRNKPKT